MIVVRITARTCPKVRTIAGSGVRRRRAVPSDLLPHRALPPDSPRDVPPSDLLPHRPCPQTHREMYHLRPNRTYEFRAWAVNEMGAGPPVTVSATTRPELSDLGKHYTTLFLLPSPCLLLNFLHTKILGKVNHKDGSQPSGNGRRERIVWQSQVLLLFLPLPTSEKNMKRR